MNRAKDGKVSLPPVGRGIAKISSLSFRMPWITLGCLSLLCVGSLLLAWFRLDFKTHRDDMISNKKWCQQNWKRYLAEFGQDDDLIVLARNGTEQEKIAALDAIAQRLASHPQVFDRIFYKVDLSGIRDRSLMFLESPQIKAISGHLANMAPLLEFPFAWNLFTLNSLTGEAHAKLKQLEARGSTTPSDLAFFEQFANIIRAASKSISGSAEYSNPWIGLLPAGNNHEQSLDKPSYLFSPDKSLALLMARPTAAEEGEFVTSRPAVDLIRKIMKEYSSSNPRVELGLTGLPVLEADEMAASQSDSTRASWIAFAGVLGLYIIVFRSWRYPVLTITTLLVGTILSLGWLTLTVGHLNLLSATFAVMLIGLGDYGVLWVSAYDESRKRNHEPFEALMETAIRVGPSIFTAACTTSLAFFAAMLADFQAVSEMGWIAGSGILLCMASCYTTLPALLAVSERKNSTLNESRMILAMPQEQSVSIWFRYPKGSVFASIIGTLLFLIPATKLSYDHNLLHLQSPSLDSVVWEKHLLEKMPQASWHAVTFTATREEALEWKKKFESMADVQMVAEVASLLPQDQSAKKPLLEDIQHRLRLLPKRGSKPAHPTANSGTLQKSLDQLAAEKEWEKLPGKLSETVQEIKEFQKALQTAGSMANSQLRAFEEQVTGDLIENLHKLREVSTPKSITADDIPVSLRQRYLSDSGQWLLRIFPRQDLWQYDNLKDFVNKIQQMDARATGKPFTTLEGLRSMKAGFQWAGIYALIAIVGVLAWDFRKLSKVLVALIPLAMGTCITMGCLHLLGYHLNPANMIAFPILVGVGIDNAVHILHDFHQRNRGVYYKPKSATLKGIAVAGLTTVLGFGSLMFSTHLGLASLGLMLALGVSACMICSIFWLPNLLGLRKPVSEADSSRSRLLRRKSA